MQAKPQELRTAANQLREIATDLINDVRSLHANAEMVMSSHWTGDASTTHVAAWRDWSDAARQLVCALSYDAQLLTHSAAEFTAADRAFAGSLA